LFRFRRCHYRRPGYRTLVKYRLIVVVAVGILLPISAVVLLATLVPPTDCRSEMPDDLARHWFSAIQTKVQPWRGRHHVFGTFMLPQQYKFDHLYTVRLIIDGVDTDFIAGSPEDEDVQGAQSRPGFYFKRVYLSTRTALWLLLTGHFADLKMACHWWLVITERNRSLTN